MPRSIWRRWSPLLVIVHAILRRTINLPPHLSGRIKYEIRAKYCNVPSKLQVPLLARESNEYFTRDASANNQSGLRYRIRHNFTPPRPPLGYEALSMPEPIVHFEIPANDVQRAIKFCEEALGWK